MESLLRLKESFMGYISPAKQKRTTKTSSPKKVNMLQQCRDALFVEAPRAQKVISGRVAKPSSWKPQVRPKKGERKGADVCAVEEVDEEYEGKPEAAEWLSVDEEESLSISDDTTLISQDTEDTEISGDEKVRNYLSNRSVASSARPKDPTQTSVHDFHEDETALWRQFDARGNEPILPSHWSLDFRTLPADLFSANLEETFIHSASGSDFKGIRALLTLFDLGPRVRERREAGRAREEVIDKAFKDYMKWAETDGGYIKKNFIPVHAVVAVKPGTPVSEMSKALESQLALLAYHHRRYLSAPNPNGTTLHYRRPPPLLYGILIVRSKFIVCTYDSALEGNDAFARTLAAFDFQEIGMDVWNSFAVAIVAITVRNQMMRLAQIGELESADEEDESDPDPDL